MITYRFFFEGPIAEFGCKSPDLFFFPGGLFLNLAMGAPFSSQEKNASNRFSSWGAVFESGKNTIPYTFSEFFFFHPRKIKEKSVRSTNHAPASPCQSKAEILFHISGQWRGPVSSSHPRQLEHRCCNSSSDSARQNGAPPQPPRLFRPPPHQRGLSSSFGACQLRQEAPGLI